MPDDTPIEPVTGRLTGETIEVPGDITFGGELIAPSVPLLEQALDNVNRDVIVFIPGGIQVDGRLLAVDDDTLVLTIEDREHRFHVAIESIAVLAVKR